MNINPITLIPANHYLTRKEFQKDGDRYLTVSEFYCDTIQGEGVHMGVPSVFLRLTGCSLHCSYCDTKEVWRYGTPWTFKELIELMERVGLDVRLLGVYHLVITGGSPLLQQDRLHEFLKFFNSYFGFRPFVEIENECTIMPKPTFSKYIDCWNNSPKLSSCNLPAISYYKPNVIRVLSRFPNSWFKFVISRKDDWREIEANFLQPNLIRRDQIILMPEGTTKEELEQHRELVIQMAVDNYVRYSTREHIVLWGKAVGV